MILDMEAFNFFCHASQSFHYLKESYKPAAAFSEEGSVIKNSVVEKASRVKSCNSCGDNRIIFSALTIWTLTESKDKTENRLIHDMKHTLKVNGGGNFKNVETAMGAVEAEYEVPANIWEELTVLYESPDGQIRCRMTEKEKKIVVHDVVRKTEEWLYERKLIDEERDYFELMQNCRKFADRPYMETVKTPWDQLKKDIAVELKRRLAILLLYRYA